MDTRCRRQHRGTDAGRQKCGSETLNFWAIASDGNYEFAVMSGVDAQGAAYLLSMALSPRPTDGGGR